MVRFSEILDTDVPFELKQLGTDYRYTFLVQGRPFSVILGFDDDLALQDAVDVFGVTGNVSSLPEYIPQYTLVFRDENDSMDVTGKGGAPLVFSGVASCVKDFFSREQEPLILTFNAKEPSRVRLYNHFAKLLSKEFNALLSYSSDEETSDNKSYYLWFNVPQLKESTMKKTMTLNQYHRYVESVWKREEESAKQRGCPSEKLYPYVFSRVKKIIEDVTISDFVTQSTDPKDYKDVVNTYPVEDKKIQKQSDEAQNETSEANDEVNDERDEDEEDREACDCSHDDEGPFTEARDTDNMSDDAYRNHELLNSPRAVRRLKKSNAERIAGWKTVVSREIARLRSLISKGVPAVYDSWADYETDWIVDFSWSSEGEGNAEIYACLVNPTWKKYAEILKNKTGYDVAQMFKDTMHDIESHQPDAIVPRGKASVKTESTDNDEVESDSQDDERPFTESTVRGVVRHLISYGWEVEDAAETVKDAFMKHPDWSREQSYEIADFLNQQREEDPAFTESTDSDEACDCSHDDEGPFTEGTFTVYYSTEDGSDSFDMEALSVEDAVKKANIEFSRYGNPEGAEVEYVEPRAPNKHSYDPALTPHREEVITSGGQVFEWRNNSNYRKAKAYGLLKDFMFEFTFQLVADGQSTWPNDWKELRNSGVTSTLRVSMDQLNNYDDARPRIAPDVLEIQPSLFPELNKLFKEVVKSYHSKFGKKHYQYAIMTVKEKNIRRMDFCKELLKSLPTGWSRDEDLENRMKTSPNRIVNLKYFLFKNSSGPKLKESTDPESKGDTDNPLQEVLNANDLLVAFPSQVVAYIRKAQQIANSGKISDVFGIEKILGAAPLSHDTLSDIIFSEDFRIEDTILREATQSTDNLSDDEQKYLDSAEELVRDGKVLSGKDILDILGPGALGEDWLNEYFFDPELQMNPPEAPKEEINEAYEDDVPFPGEGYDGVSSDDEPLETEAPYPGEGRDFEEAAPKRRFPDTSAGAVECLLSMADTSIKANNIRAAYPDPQVDGVWEILFKTPILGGDTKAIVYMAGYREPNGEIRRDNDFETGTELDEETSAAGMGFGGLNGLSDPFPADAGHDWKKDAEAQGLTENLGIDNTAARRQSLMLAMAEEGADEDKIVTWMIAEHQDLLQGGTVSESQLRTEAQRAVVTAEASIREAETSFKKLYRNSAKLAKALKEFEGEITPEVVKKSASTVDLTGEMPKGIAKKQTMLNTPKKKVQEARIGSAIDKIFQKAPKALSDTLAYVGIVTRDNGLPFTSKGEIVGTINNRVLQYSKDHPESRIRFDQKSGKILGLSKEQENALKAIVDADNSAWDQALSRGKNLNTDALVKLYQSLLQQKILSSSRA